jgi:hypothetical protein
MKSPFVVQQYDNFEAYNIYNHVMSRSPSFIIKQHVQFQEGGQYWLQPTICPPTKLKPRTVCCQEGEDDVDMTPSDTTIDYKMCSFLYLHSDFGYNSLGSTCTCRYFNVGTNMFQSASPSKLNFWCVGSPIVLHWEGHNSSIRSAIKGNEHLMDFQIDLVPPQYHIDKASKSSRHSAAISIGCYGVVAGLLFTLGTQAQVGACPQEDGEHLRDFQGRPPTWPPP